MAYAGPRPANGTPARFVGRQSAGPHRALDYRRRGFDADMGIAISQVTSRIRSVNATDPAPIHWPSAVVGLALAIAAASAEAPAAPPLATVVPTPIPAPTVTPEPTRVVERVKIANALGSGVNFRAKAGGKAPLLKTLPEGTILEVIGTDETADGMVWRNVRDQSGASGWMAGKFLARVQQ